jgi:hypothetical protein
VLDPRAEAPPPGARRLPAQIPVREVQTGAVRGLERAHRPARRVADLDALDLGPVRDGIVDRRPGRRVLADEAPDRSAA